MTHGAMLVCDFSLLPFGPWLFQDLLKSCTILSLYTTKKNVWNRVCFLFWDALQRNAPLPLRNWGVPGTPRGVVGACPGRGRGVAKILRPIHCRASKKLVWRGFCEGVFFFQQVLILLSEVGLQILSRTSFMERR